MSVLALEGPPSLALAGPNGLTPAEQRQARQLEEQARRSVTLAEIALVLGGGFLLFRMYAVRRMMPSLPKEPSSTTLRLLAMAAWKTFQPTWLKITVPAVATAYTMGMVDARRGEVPPELLHLFAEQYAADIGEYFNTTSSEALDEGFNAYVNRKLPKRMAADRVLRAYGLNPRQMRAVVAAEQLGAMKVTSPIELSPDAKSDRYIETQLIRRAQDIGDNEAFTAMRRGKQLTWMYLLQHGKVPASTKRRWITAHDEKVCKYCGPLHGKAVPINAPFKTALGPVWVPALHPNCRCDITIEVPTRELFVAKRYDPHQRRGDDGRWVEMGTRLNAMPVVAARTETKLQHSRQAVRYVTEPRFITTPLKERDPQMARLAAGAAMWSRSMKNVDRVRAMAAEDNAYFARKMYSFRGAKESVLDHLIKTVKAAPATAPTLYRGLVVDLDRTVDFERGQVMDLPLSSFSTDRDLAVTFATKWGPRAAENRAKREGIQLDTTKLGPLIFEVEEGSRSLHISPLVAERQAEWISQGKFEITEIISDFDHIRVKLRQLDEEIAKADWWREIDHPRDAEGQFTFKRTGVATDVETETELPSVIPPSLEVAGQFPSLSAPATTSQLPSLSQELPALTGQLPSLSALSSLSAQLPQLSSELPQMAAQLPELSAAVAEHEAVSERIDRTAAAINEALRQAIRVTTTAQAPAKVGVRAPIKTAHYFIPEMEEEHRETGGYENPVAPATGSYVKIWAEDLFVDKSKKTAELVVNQKRAIDDAINRVLLYEEMADTDAAREHVEAAINAEVFNNSTEQFKNARREARGWGINREDFIQNIYTIDQTSHDPNNTSALPAADKGGVRAPGTYQVVGITDMTGSGIPARYIRLRWVGDQSYVDTETPNHLDQPHPWEED